MRELEVYIHIPFCVKKCNYCDFLSFSSDREEKKRYFRALKAEMDSFFASDEFLSGGYTVSTVFFGGGTPSLPDAELICDLLSCIPGKPEEVTLEANPGTLDRKKLEIYRKAGINRLSIGLQSSDNEALKLLGRIHTWEQFLENFEQARLAGFQNINIDLMSGLPGQTLESWERVLHQVSSLMPEHISAYSLILEEGTPFFERYNSHPEELPTEEDVALLYEMTGKVLAKYGYEQYEISNYALPGKECRHNIGYWYRTEYIGFGLGAASLLSGKRFRNTEDRICYLSSAEKHGREKEKLLRKDMEVLSQKEQMEETMFLGLRCLRGVSSSEFYERFGKKMMDIYGPVIEKYRKQGFLFWEGERLCLTKQALLVSNCIMQDFLLEEE